MKSKSLLTCFFLLVLVITSVACQSTSTAVKENEPEATQVEAVQNTQAAPAQGAATAGDETPSGGSGDFSLEDFSVGLDRLSSYRQSLVLTFDGTVSGSETHAKTSARRTVIREPAAELTWIEIDDLPLQMFGTVGEAAYHQTGADGACVAEISSAAADEALPGFQLQDLPAVIGANAAGEETVNGLPAMHYTFDEAAIGRAADLSAKGDLWIAKEGGYVVKYSLSMIGENDQLGLGVSGTQSWMYDLTEAGAVSDPGLPAGCIAEYDQDIAPLPSDAKDIMRMPNFLQFNVPLTLEQAAQFYREQAVSMEWEEIPVEPMDDADQIINFKTAKGGLVSVRLHKQEGETRVTVQSLPDKP